MLQTAFGASCINRVSVFEWHKRFKEGRESVRDVGGVRKSIHQSWLAKGLGIGLGLLWWVFKGVQQEISSEKAALFKSGQWHFHQDEGHWYVHTRGLPWSLPEVVGMVQRVHYSRRRVLRRGLEFHVCTINKTAHTPKIWKLI